MNLLPGYPDPLGASWDGEGVNFALYSEHARAVDLCLIDEAGAEVRIPLAQRTGFVFHAYVPAIAPGQRYTYRVHGGDEEANGRSPFDPSVALIDPYARAVVSGNGASAEVQCVVVDTEYDWEGDAAPHTPFNRTVIYEGHVGSLSRHIPQLPAAVRGTYSALRHPATLDYWRDLGVTALQLLPVQYGHEEGTLGFFALDPHYRSGAEPGSELNEFKDAVKALHRANIEVILDVAFDRTGEGVASKHSFRGIDPLTYYGSSDLPIDVDRSANRLNVRHPHVFGLIVDSLRYWAAEVHVDGFRFPSSAVLARELQESDQLSAFLTLMQQSRALAQVKVISDPWQSDLSSAAPTTVSPRWAERNARYCEVVRTFWNGGGTNAADFAEQLCGGNMLAGPGRRPSSSVNFIASHETNADQAARKPSPAMTRRARDASYAREQRNLFATLLVSQGVPLLRGGSETGAVDSDDAGSRPGQSIEGDPGLFRFVRRLLRIRRHHPALHRSKLVRGRKVRGTQMRDIAWFAPNGTAVPDKDLRTSNVSAIAMVLAGRGLDDVDASGRPIVDDDFFIAFNPSDASITFQIPALDAVQGTWQLLVDTADDHAEQGVAALDVTTLDARSIKVFRRPSRAVRTGHAVHTLTSTYRLQMNDAFRFADAQRAVAYLSDLGVTDVYLSPILGAARGSTHGYDVVDYERLNDGLGSQTEFDALSEALRARRMGILLDWVPNHMGIVSGQNRFWDDVLENGPSSSYADVFDIDWNPPKSALRGKVLLPILGDQYGEVLERGELKVVWEEQRFRIAYHDKRFPIDPKSLTPLVERLVEITKRPDSDPIVSELQSIALALQHLPDASDVDPKRARLRAVELGVVKRRLVQVFQSSPELRVHLEEVLREWNEGTADTPQVDALDDLLRAQNYRLSSWRVASEEINYRRFFDINELAAVKMENQNVFEAAHAYLFKMIDEGRVQALRLDHTDGLYDPLAYFEALQQRFRFAEGGHGWTADDLARPLAVLVEKILEPGESLPPEWPVDGTTGYEFANATIGLAVDPRSERDLDAMYRRATSDSLSYKEHVYASKHHVLRFSLASEVSMLARVLERIAGSNRKWQDFTLGSLTTALVETLAAFPVYRTYLREGDAPSERDVLRVRAAVRTAARRAPSLSASVFRFLESVLLLSADVSPEERASHRRFALRFQQLTGPVMAKSVEDTAFYRYSRLVCLNEVGGDPSKFGTSVEDFHSQNLERARSWPFSMLTTSTHDTKRGEDTSMRIAAITEAADAWRASVERWTKIAASKKDVVDGEPAPSGQTEYLFYQAVVGAWPYGWNGEDDLQTFSERVAAFLEKATKEEKRHTSWTNPEEEYDRAVRAFATDMIADSKFRSGMRRFCELIEHTAVTSGLAQTLLRLCSPGVPDTYQGSELWNQSLVDPDNRRPVDYPHRAHVLHHIQSNESDRPRLVRELLRNYADGAIKLYVSYVALTLRRSRRDLFLRGDYEPLETDAHAVAFARNFGHDRVICCVPRLTRTLNQGAAQFALGNAWNGRTVRLGRSGLYTNLFTGKTTHLRAEAPLATIFEEFPVALLLSTQDPESQTQ